MIGLFYPNRCVQGLTVSGGSWLAALPASNVLKSALAEVARSSSASTSDTKIQIDLGSARSLRAFAVVNHNLSASAQWRVLLGTTSGGSDVYSGTLADWLQVSGIESASVALGMEDGEYLRDSMAALIVLPAFYSARHVTIEIADSSNPDGYVQIGRVFAGGGFIPTINAEYGLRDSWIDLSTKEFSESGASWNTPRRRLRQVEFVLDGLTDEEGSYLHEMQRTLGTVGEVLYIPDLVDKAVMQQYGFLGEMRELSAVEYPYHRRRRLPVSIRQKG